MPIGLGGLAVIQGVGNAIQGGIDAITSRRNTERTIEANKKMADYQYSKDLDMWNKGNAYNAPQAQMDRLKSAGLNPNLVYGSGTVAGQSAGQLPKYNAPTMDYSHNLPIRVGDGISKIGEFQNYRVQQAQIDNLNAQRHATYAETEIKKLEAIKRMNENQYLPTYLDQRNTSQGYDIGNKALNQNILQQRFQQEFFKTDKQSQLFDTQMDALKQRTLNQRQQYEQKAGAYPLSLQAMRARNAYLDRQTQSLRQRNTMYGDEVSSRLLTNSYKNDLMIQQAESQRLQNETFYLRMFGTGALNLTNQLQKLNPKNLLPTPRRTTPQKNSPADFQRKGYGQRKK